MHRPRRGSNIAGMGGVNHYDVNFFSLHFVLDLYWLKSVHIKRMQNSYEYLISSKFTTAMA